MSGFLKKVLSNLPIISDYYLYYRQFYQETASCRGIYDSFDEAQSATSNKKPFGYNHEDLHRGDSVSRNTAGCDVGSLNNRDYFVLFWLNQAIKNSKSLFNLGGNVGLEYYAYREIIDIPQDLSWICCEISEIVKAGKELALKNNVKNLRFTTDFMEIESSDVLLTCGTLQYIEDDLAAMLSKIKQKPKHIIINRVPFYNGNTYVTLQNLGYTMAPYCIRNKDQFVENMESTGYQLVDHWKDWRVLKIPFHSERTVEGYHGLYFRLKENKV